MTTQITDREDLIEKALKGAALLDEVIPEWRKEVNKDKLRITSGEDCVLGQLYGSYGRGLTLLEPHGVYSNPSEFGFICGDGKYCECVELTAIWKEII